MNQYNKLIHGDCLKELDLEENQIEDKSVQMVCIDPPYNIQKDNWDSNWGAVKKGYKKKEGKFENYFDWLGSVFEILSRKLKDNGSFFFFHNDFRMMAELDKQIQSRTNLQFKQFIVWNKRFDGSPNKGYLDGFIAPEQLNNFQKMTEYICFYVFDNSWKLKAERKKRNIKQIDISKEILSKTGGVTGWYSNLETGKNYPTEDTIKPITKHLGLTLDDLVPKFRNQRTHHSVWNYDLDRIKLGHITPKPVALLENIIQHTTDKNDLVLDCFMGSGSMGVACNNTGRNFIGIEKEKEYFDLAKKRIGKC